MAKVTIGISEYDMLRNNLKNAEARIKDLKDTIEGLKDKSRVIIKSVPAKFNYEKALNRYNSYHYYNDDWTDSESRFKDSIYCGLYSSVESSQYIGFDDIKEEVERELNNRYETELKNKSSILDDLRKGYEEKCIKVEAKSKEKWEDKITTLKDIIENYKKSNAKLIEENKELSKSLEEKQKEAFEELQIAQKKYEDLVGKKKGFFSYFIKRINGHKC